MPSLLSRLAAKPLPAEVPAPDVPDLLELMAVGWVKGKVDTPLKGKHDYGVQPPGLAVAITEAGRKALGMGA